MKKLISLTLFFIIFFSSFFVNKVFAANVYITGCLRVVETKLPGVTIDGKTDHIAKVAGSGFPVGKDIYIVGCISTNTGIHCTSGDANIDKRLKEIGFTTNSFSGHEFKAENNPVRSQDGKVEVILRSATPRGEDHSFFGVAEVTREEYQGEARTVQLGTFGFSDDPKKCIGIHWDPKGRVFDSQTLEPLPAIQVTLLDSNKNSVNLPGVANPVETKEDGLFNFFVPNGTYYLSISKPSYQHPLELSEVNSQYSQIYYCDPEVGKALYYDQFPIKEQGKLIHCDVPLKPLKTPYIAPSVTLLNYGQIRLGDVTKIYGTFSHPLTKVKIENKNGLIKEIIADKYGGWTYFADNNQMPVNVTGLKNNAIYSQTKNNWVNKIISFLFRPVFSQSSSSSFTFHPILTYIEGYAFDNKGEVIPQAIINIVPEMTKKTYYTTFADGKGFFRIETNKLPIFPYYIQIINPKNKNLVNNITTTLFVENNKKYLQEKGINLLTAQVLSTPSSQITEKTNLSPTGKQRFDFTTTNEPKTTISPIGGSQQKSTVKNYLLIIVGIILLLFIAIFVIYYFYTKNKNTTTSL